MLVLPSTLRLLAARWIESGHFPLSNMYESLLFLAWGITAVHLVVTERDGFSKSAIPGALAAPTASHGGGSDVDGAPTGASARYRARAGVEE